MVTCVSLLFIHQMVIFIFSVGHLVRHSNIFCRTFIKNEFYACFPFLQLGGALVNYHSPVVIVVFDPRYDYSYQALYTYSRSIPFNNNLCITAWLSTDLFRIVIFSNLISFQVMFQQGYSARRCTVCMDREISHFFMPCGHTTCLVCGLQIESHSQLCPSCRNPFIELTPLSQ